MAKEKKGTDHSTPKPEPERLSGSPRGYHDLAEKTRFSGGKTPTFASDPEVQAALRADKEIEKEIEVELEDSVEHIDETLETLVDSSKAGHAFANGISIPFPYNGFPTTNYATCSQPRRDENRGCPVWTHCPLRDKGPWLLAYMDKRNRNQIRSITCRDFLVTGLVHMPWIQLLPGISWEGTIMAEYERFADGRLPEAGPGKTKTAIKLTAHKSHLPPELFPPAELVTEYQRLRRRGEIRAWQSS